MVGRRLPAPQRVVGRHKTPQNRAITTPHRGRFLFTPTTTCAISPRGVKILLVSSDCAHRPSSVLVGRSTIPGSLAIAPEDTNDSHRGGTLDLETLRRKSPAHEDGQRRAAEILIELPVPGRTIGGKRNIR